MVIRVSCDHVCNSHDTGIVEWISCVVDAHSELTWESSLETSSAFVTDNDDFKVLFMLLFDIISNFTDDT